MEIQTYPIAQLFWEGEGTVLVQDSSAKQLMILPIKFLRIDSDSESFTPTKGPRFKFKHRPSVEGEETSTMSDSNRSSANQMGFREFLLARDSNCLLSDASFVNCTPCHILPQSRPEYYTEVLGYDPGFLFMPSFGLLLRDDLHHSFDRGEWALYPVDDGFVVHMFVALEPLYMQFHGKIINRSHFRAPVNSHPDQRLLNFHYQQCAIKRFRRVSAD